MSNTATIERPVYKREVRRIPQAKTPEQYARDHGLGLLKALVEMYPKEAVEFVRRVALDKR